ncbi:MAG: family efflux transporter [Clostridiaceae bacterium]|jgi:putative MATE family efflux protein|nr:family efflux transporter [Clostridiaceae bacterium]MDF2949335.1 family efflux transporter [Sedimentibacter sp.]
MNDIIKRNKAFINTMIIIAIPVVIQNMISIGLNMIDTVMVSELGENAISAVGLANRIYFIFTTICFGIYSGASIFVAQYWGAKDMVSIKKVFGIDLIIGSLLSLIFAVLVFFFRNQIMRIFIDDPYVIELGSEYLKVISFSYPLTAISFAFSFNCRAIHKLKMPTVINAVALLINTFFNWILITGNLGFKALGVEGAAIATLLARIVEFVALIFFIYKDKNHPLAGTIKELTSWDVTMLKKVLKTSFPVIMSETAWSIGTSVYFIAYGFMGSYAIAVVQIAFNISDFFQTLFFGIGNASAVMIGNEIGKNDIDKAMDYSNKFVKITLVLSFVFASLLLVSRNYIIRYFNLEPITSEYLSKTLIVYSLYFTPKMFSYIFICGILRAGGDTKFCMFVDIITIWGIGVPLSFISVLLFKLPIHLVIALVFSEEIIKSITVTKRYLSKKWMNNLIMD